MFSVLGSNIFFQKIWLILCCRYAHQSGTVLNTTRAELKAFHGLCINMAILKLPQKQDYWRTTRWLLKTSFGEVMPRDRFLQIWRFLHLQDNAQPDGGDKLIKVRPLIEHLNETFKAVYTPHGKFTVDESMVKFKGRLGFRQYMPAKPTKWGIKIWSLCEADTGYLYSFQVYTGRDANRGPEVGLAHNVVRNLTVPLQNTNAELFMDNYYTSTDLLLELKRNGIQACGTIRSNRRGLPDALRPKNVVLQKHQSLVAQKGTLVCSVWKDTKPVLTLSNYHDPTEMGRVTRKGQGRDRQQVNAPQMLCDYQKNMRGVDLMDQLISYHMFNHRSKKWWRRLYFYLLQAAILNSYILAKETHDAAIRCWPHFRDFIEDLGESLVCTFRSTRAAPLVRAPEGPADVHNIIKMYNKKKTCKECALSRAAGAKQAQRTVYGCTTCNEPVHQNCSGQHQRRHNRAHLRQ